ncbi:MAG: DUF2953 domain-containing protein, partial [Methanothrix sp.]
MQFPLAVLTAAILLIMLLLGALLLFPVRLILEISKRGELLSGSLHLFWLGLTIKRVDLALQTAEELVAGLAGPSGETPGKRENDRERQADLDRARDRKRASDMGPGREGGDKRSRGGTSRLRPQRMIRAAPQIARIFYDLLSSIVFRISGRVLLGLDDPAETAILSGQIWALSSALGRSFSQLSIDPWFEGERLEGEVFVEMQVRLVWGLAAVLLALRIKEVRQTGME